MCASDSSWDCRRSVVCKPTGNKRLVHVHLVAGLLVPSREHREAPEHPPNIPVRCAVGVLAELLGAVDESRWHDHRRDGGAGGGLVVTAGVGSAAGVRVARFTTAITDATAITSATIATVASPRRSHLHGGFGGGSGFGALGDDRFFSGRRR